MNAQRKFTGPDQLQKLIARELAGLTESEKAMLAYCEAAAEDGRELESGDDIADALGYESSSMGRYIMQGLERKGYIRIESYQRGRRVWVKSIDKWTKAPRCTVPHWRTIQDRSAQTPTIPIHILAQQVPTLSIYLHKMMREENMTMVAAQIALMSRGVAHREFEKENGNG